MDSHGQSRVDIAVLRRVGYLLIDEAMGNDSGLRDDGDGGRAPHVLLRFTRCAAFLYGNGEWASIADPKLSRIGATHRRLALEDMVPLLLCRPEVAAASHIATDLRGRHLRIGFTQWSVALYEDGGWEFGSEYAEDGPLTGPVRRPLSEPTPLSQLAS